MSGQVESQTNVDTTDSKVIHVVSHQSDDQKVEDDEEKKDPFVGDV